MGEGEAAAPSPFTAAGRPRVALKMAPKDESAAVNNNWEAVKSGGVAVKSQCASSLTLYSTVKSEVKGEEGAVKDEVVTGEGVAKDGQRGAKNGEAGAEHGAKPSIAYAMHVHDPEQSRLAVAHARMLTDDDVCTSTLPLVAATLLPQIRRVVPDPVPDPQP